MNVFFKPTLIFKFGVYEYEFFQKDSMDECSPILYMKFQTKKDPIVGSKVNVDTVNYASILISRNIFNLYIYRYAQTLLTYAEAKVRAGQLDAKAYQALNMVRRRANKVDIYSPSVYDITSGLTAQQFTDSVVWERAWELCAEAEGRWFDLMRLEMVEKLSDLRDPDDNYNMPNTYTKDFYYRPIPDYDKNLNTELK
jgi:hypothetical protein